MKKLFIINFFVLTLLTVTASTCAFADPGSPQNAFADPGNPHRYHSLVVAVSPEPPGVVLFIAGSATLLAFLALKKRILAL